MYDVDVSSVPQFSVPGQDPTTKKWTFGFREAAYRDPTRNPARVPVAWENIPAVLRGHARWVRFRTYPTLSDTPGEPAWTREPWRVTGTKRRAKSNGDDLASPTERCTWGTFENAQKDVQGAAEGERRLHADRSEEERCSHHPAIRAGKLDDNRALVPVDLDDVRNPETGEVTPWGLEEVRRLNSYTEVSPTGTGLKVLVFADPREKFPHKKHTAPDGRTIEFLSDGFCTMTGQRLDGTPAEVNDRTAELVALRTEFTPPKKHKAKKDQAKKPAGKCPLATDDQVIEKVKSEATRKDKPDPKWAHPFGDDPEADREAFLAEYHGDDSRADMALIGKLAFYTWANVDWIERLMRRSVMSHGREGKWDSPRKYKDEDSTWLRSEIQNFLDDEWNGDFYTGAKPAGKKAARFPKGKWGSERSMGNTKWLWDKRILERDLSVWAGDPGAGKSQLAAHVAAFVTRGLRLPFDSRPAIEPGVVIYFSVEAIGDVNEEDEEFLPRFAAAGGDPDRIMMVSKPFELPAQAEGLEEYIRDLEAEAQAAGKGKVQLVIIDPINDYIERGRRSQDDMEIRHALKPLNGVAKRRRCAILALTHTNKTPGASAMNRIAGCRAYVGVCRAASIVVKDRLDIDQSVIAPVRLSRGKEEAGLGFRREDVTITDPMTGKDIDTIKLLGWSADDRTADGLVGADFKDGGGKRGTPGRPDDQRERAKLLLRERLAAGPVRKDAIEREATEKGISAATLTRACTEMGVVSYRKYGPDNPYGKATWGLPGRDQAPETAETGTAPPYSNFDLTTTTSNDPPSSTSNQYSHREALARRLTSWAPQELNGTH